MKRSILTITSSLESKHIIDLTIDLTNNLVPRYDIKVSTFCVIVTKRLIFLQPTVLNLLFAQLELDYGYIRAVTPYYSVYEISPSTDAGWRNVLADKSPAAMTIRQEWKAKSKGYLVIYTFFR